MCKKDIRSNQIKAIDFFCGAGGVTRGFLNAGIDVICGIDNDPNVRRTYIENNKRPNSKQVKFILENINSLNYGTIEDLLIKETYERLIFSACAPCQIFTKINTEKKNREKESNYILRFIDFVEFFKPDYLFIENVTNVNSEKYGFIIDQISNKLRSMGYDCKHKNINAKKYGIPQNRPRKILLASRCADIFFPEETHGKEKKKFLTVKDVFEANNLSPLFAGETDLNDNLHRASNLSAENLWRIKHTVKDGGTRTTWMQSKPVNCFERHKNSYTDVYSRMYWDKPSPTITTRFNSFSNGRFGHPEEDRAISLREGALLQTFPIDYKFSGNLVSITKQIGNAVPVKLAEIFGRHFIDINFQKYLLPNILKNKSDQAFNQIIRMAKDGRLSNKLISDLSIMLANSGDKLVSNEFPATDIPSTGGPSSLSTIICPYLLVIKGFNVLKLGVKGRPAGGIDVMAQIPGYKINFTKDEVIKCIKESKYCHFASDEKFAPLDKKLFYYRSSVGAKAIPELVIASILSKKIAVGIKRIGLDIRVFAGANFGDTVVEAKKNAEKFVEVANILDIKTKYYITEIRSPLQPYIGRGEALIALKNILHNDMSLWLRNHFNQCLKMVADFVDTNINCIEIDINKLIIPFEKNLLCQGSSLKKFYKKVEEIENSKRYSIRAKANGYLTININILRNVLTQIQNNISDMQYPDNIGVILKKQSGDSVLIDEEVCSVRMTNYLEKNILQIEKAFSVKK